MKVAVIGAGVMGRAILSSVVLADGVGRVAVADAVAETADNAARAHAGAAVPVVATTSPADAARDATAVVLAVKPQHMNQVLEQLAPVLAEDALLISIAAGLSTSWFAQRSNAAIIRVMPNTPAAIGMGVSAMCPGPGASQDQQRIAEELLRATGLVLWVAEEQLGAITAISGSGPAYVFAMIDALAEAGTALGLSRAVAIELATHTVAGSGTYAQRSGVHPAILREQVSSPGGTTVAALAELDQRAVRAAYVAAARASRDRADELARDLT